MYLRGYICERRACGYVLERECTREGIYLRGYVLERACTQEGMWVLERVYGYVFERVCT